jgi:hypothetical protein
MSFYLSYVTDFCGGEHEHAVCWFVTSRGLLDGSLPIFRRNQLSSSFLFHAAKLGGIASQMTVILT